MPGLKLKLRPDEQILINGAVIQNGPYAVELTVKTPDTYILRLRDALHPDEVNTPVKRVCYVAQLAVAGTVGVDAALSDFTKGVSALKQVFRDEGSQALLEEAEGFAQTHNFYKAMQTMRRMIKYEEAVLMYPEVRNNAAGISASA